MTSTAVSETAQKLKAALELLGTNGENWIQKVYSNGEGGRCMSGACLAIDGGDESLWSILYNFVMSEVGQAPSTFNDAPERTFAEVKAVFEKAMQAERSKIGG